MESLLTNKGQVTIPKEIRAHLHIGPGDRIKFLVRPDGGVAILPTASLRGMLRTKRTDSVAVMNKDRGSRNALVQRPRS